MLKLSERDKIDKQFNKNNLNCPLDVLFIGRVDWSFMKIKKFFFIVICYFKKKLLSVFKLNKIKNIENAPDTFFYFGEGIV